MTVIGFIGKPRTGKTLHMTLMAYNNYQHGYKIFANYKLSFPNERLDVYDMLQIPFNDVEREPKTLCIQEVDKIFDSRSSMRKENKLLSSLTGQSGKRNLNIFYDTQFPNRIDRSLRDVTEHIIATQPPTLDSRTKEPVAFHYEMIDLFDYSTKSYTIPVPVLKPFFSMYDSYETTEPLVTDREVGE